MIVPVDRTTELGQLLSRTNLEKPKLEDRQALDKYLVQHGKKEIAKVGDLAKVLMTNLIENTFSSNHGFSIAVASHVAGLLENFGYANASPLERLLIDSIVLNWVRLHTVELRFEESRKNDMTLSQIEQWERRLTLCQHRYLRAIESLAKVRRLLKEPQAPRVAVLLKQEVNVKNQEVLCVTNQ